MKQQGSGQANSYFEVEKRFGEVCEICKLLKVGKWPISPGSPYGRLSRRLLERFAASIQRNIAAFNSGRIEISVSKGQGYLPKILWIAVLLKGEKVSQRSSVAVCFGRNGEGAVAGLMSAASSGGVKLTNVMRSKSPKIQVDVDGTTVATRYNDRFVNPKEFLVQEISGRKLLNHLDQSIQMMLS